MSDDLRSSAFPAETSLAEGNSMNPYGVNRTNHQDQAKGRSPDPLAQLSTLPSVANTFPSFASPLAPNPAYSANYNSSDVNKNFATHLAHGVAPAFDPLILRTQLLSPAIASPSIPNYPSYSAPEMISPNTPSIDPFQRNIHPYSMSFPSVPYINASNQPTYSPFPSPTPLSPHTHTLAHTPQRRLPLAPQYPSFDPAVFSPHIPMPSSQAFAAQHAHTAPTSAPRVNDNNNYTNNSATNFTALPNNDQTSSSSPASLHPSTLTQSRSPTSASDSSPSLRPRTTSNATPSNSPLTRAQHARSRPSPLQAPLPRSQRASPALSALSLQAREGLSQGQGQGLGRDVGSMGDGVLREHGGWREEQGRSGISRQSGSPGKIIPRALSPYSSMQREYRDADDDRFVRNHGEMIASPQQQHDTRIDGSNFDNDAHDVDPLHALDDDHASSQMLLPSLNLSKSLSTHSPAYSSLPSASTATATFAINNVHGYAGAQVPLAAPRLFRQRSESRNGGICSCCSSCVKAFTSMSMSSLAGSSLLGSSSVLASSSIGFLNPAANSRLGRVSRFTRAIWRQMTACLTPILSFMANHKCFVFLLLVTLVVTLLIVVMPSSVSLHALVMPHAQVSEDLTWLPNIHKTDPIVHPVPLHPDLLLPHTSHAPLAHTNIPGMATLSRKRPFAQVITHLDVSSHPLPINALLSMLSHLSTTATTHVLLSYASQFPWSGPVAPLRAPTAYSEAHITAIVTHAHKLGLRLILDLPAIEGWTYILSLQRWSHLREDLSDSRYASLSHARVEALWSEMVDQLIRLHAPEDAVYQHVLDAIEANGTLSTFGKKEDLFFRKKNDGADGKTGIENDSGTTDFLDTGDRSISNDIEILDPTLLDFGLPLGTAFGKKSGISPYSAFSERSPVTSPSADTTHSTSQHPPALDVVAGVHIGGRPLSISRCSSCEDGVDEDHLIASRYASACAHINSLPMRKSAVSEPPTDYITSSLTSIGNSISSLLSGSHYSCYLSDAHLRQMEERNIEIVAASNPYLIVAEPAADLNGTPPVLRHYLWGLYTRHFPSRLLAGAFYRGAEKEVLMAPNTLSRLANAAAWHMLALESGAVGVALIGSARDSNDVYMHEPLLATVPVMSMALHVLSEKHFDADDRDVLFASYGLMFLPPPPQLLTLTMMKPVIISMWRDAVTLMRLAPARVEYALLHPAEAAAAISQTRVSMLAAAHAASAKGNSLYPHDSNKNTYEANKTTSTSSRGVSKAAAADADRLLRFSPLHQSSPLTMLSQHSDALFIHALPASAASSDPLLLHAPLPPSMASVTGVWDAAGAMLMWAQVVHAIANEYGDYAHSWTPETAPHSIRVATAFASTLLSTLHPLPFLAETLLQHTGVDLSRIAAHTLTLVSRGSYSGSVHDDVGAMGKEDLAVYTAPVGTSTSMSTSTPTIGTISNSNGSSNHVDAPVNLVNPTVPSEPSEKVKETTNMTSNASNAPSSGVSTTLPVIAPNPHSPDSQSQTPSSSASSSTSSLSSSSVVVTPSTSGSNAAPPLSKESKETSASLPPSATAHPNSTANATAGTAIAADSTTSASSKTPVDIHADASNDGQGNGSDGKGNHSSAAATPANAKAPHSEAEAVANGVGHNPIDVDGTVEARKTEENSGIQDISGTASNAAGNRTDLPSTSAPGSITLPPLSSTVPTMISSDLLQALPNIDTSRISIISRSKAHLYYSIAAVFTLSVIVILIWCRRSRKDNKGEYTSTRSWDLEPIADLDEELEHV